MAEGANFNSTSVGLKAQKKILSKMSSKSIAKVFIDDTSGRLLDNLYSLLKEYTGNKKEAEKVVKNVIKIVIKIGILYRNDQFSNEELSLAEDFKKKFRSTAMTIVSFYEVDFTTDKTFLLQGIRELSAILHKLIQRHLTDKSRQRIDHVFAQFLDGDLWDKIFKQKSCSGEEASLKAWTDPIIADLNSMLDEGNI